MWADRSIWKETDNMPTTEREGYTFGGWLKPDGTAFVKTSRIGEDITLHAKWTANEVPATYGEDDDFTAEDNPVSDGRGWETLPKWIGENFTQESQVLQPGYDLKTICSRLAAQTNPDNKFHYETNGHLGGIRSEIDEPGKMGTDDWETSDALTVGVGGADLTQILANPGVLLTRLVFSPNASCEQECEGMSPPKGHAIRGRGNTFTATMLLSNGMELTANANSNWNLNGWETPAETKTKETLTFDFRPGLETNALPETVKTQKVTFTSQGTGSGSSHSDEPPLSATVTVNGNRASCSNETAGSTVQYSTTSGESGYVNGRQFVLSFTANANQTKTGWFKISASGRDSEIYKVRITQTVTETWSGWSAWQYAYGGFTGNQVVIWRRNIENTYGASNCDFEIQLIGKRHYRGRYRTRTTETAYTSSVTHYTEPAQQDETQSEVLSELTESLVVNGLVAYKLQPPKVTIKFDPNGGTRPAWTDSENQDSSELVSVEIPSGMRIGNLPVTTDPTGDHNFDGWWTHQTGGTLVTHDSVFRNHATLYAHWKPVEINVTFDSNDGTGTDEVLVTLDSNGADDEGVRVTFDSNERNNITLTMEENTPPSLPDENE